MTTAAALTKMRLQAGRKPLPETILTIVMDDDNVHCLNESHLDTWWASLDPAEKAEIYEASLECPSQQERVDYPWSLLNEAERLGSSFAALSNVRLDRTGKPTTCRETFTASQGERHERST